MTDEWLLVLDGTGLYVRCAKAGQRTGLTAPDGTPTGAVTLFAQSLASMTRDVQPHRMLIAWDGGNARDWRRKICPAYKTNRSGPYSGADWVREFDAVREFCNAAGIAQWSFPEFEADDVLAAASRLARKALPDVKLVLASDDKDILQLAEDGRVWVRALGRDGILADAETVELLFGVSPKYLPALRALEGDPSDGIPGVRGVGRVKAIRMLEQGRLRWPLPVDVLPFGPVREQVDKWFSIMDLHSPPETPEAHYETKFLDIAETAWKRGNILPILEKYGMRSMAERVAAGHFW